MKSGGEWIFVKIWNSFHMTYTEKDTRSPNEENANKPLPPVWQHV